MEDLLTTLPPIDGDGPLLVLPWMAGMLAGVVGLSLAHLPVRRAWLAALLPVLGMTAVLAAAIVLGVRHPESLLVQGSVFAGLALAWLAVRARRASAAVQGGSTSYVRGAGAVVMLALAAAVAFPASALVPRATTANGWWPATGSSRRSTSAATPRRWPGSAATSTSRADPTRPTSTTRPCSTSTASSPSPRPLRHDGPLRRHGLGCH